MNRNRDDSTWEQRLRRAFIALRKTDRRRAPSFAGVLPADGEEREESGNDVAEDSPGEPGKPWNAGD